MLLGTAAYYFLFGYWIVYDLCNQSNLAPKETPFVILGLLLFITGEIGNHLHHSILGDLRKDSKGSTGHKIPKGLLFTYLTAPHYFFEIVAWLGFNMVIGFSPGGITFLIASAIVLSLFAKQRHDAYKKEFHGKTGGPKYPTKREIIIPFIF